MKAVLQNLILTACCLSTALVTSCAPQPAGMVASTASSSTESAEAGLESISAGTPSPAVSTPPGTSPVTTDPSTTPVSSGEALKLSCDGLREAAYAVIGDIKLARSEGPTPLGDAWVIDCDWIHIAAPDAQTYEKRIRIVAMIGPKLHAGAGNGAAEDCANILKYTPTAEQLPSEAPVECLVKSGVGGLTHTMQATSLQASITLKLECIEIECADKHQNATKEAVTTLAERAERGIIPTK